jgi:hypothetical protein
MLFWESPFKFHRFGSSGLNLICEGLLLGMWARGCGDPLTRAHPRKGTQANLCPMTSLAIHLCIFCRRQPIAWRSLGPDGTEAKPDQAEDSQYKERLCRRPSPHWRPQCGEESRQRSTVCRRSLYLVMWHSGHMSRPHLWGTEIFVNHKGL